MNQEWMNNQQHQMKKKMVQDHNSAFPGEG